MRLYASRSFAKQKEQLGTENAALLPCSVGSECYCARPSRSIMLASFSILKGFPR